MKSLVLGLTTVALFGLTNIATAGISTESSAPHYVLAGNEEMANPANPDDPTGGAPSVPGDTAGTSGTEDMTATPDSMPSPSGDNSMPNADAQPDMPDSSNMDTPDNNVIDTPEE